MRTTVTARMHQAVWDRKMVQPTRMAVYLVAMTASAGCGLIDAIDDGGAPWPRSEIPASHVSVALPAEPRFTTEVLPDSPCGDLVRTSFALRSQFALYSGYFIPMTEACAKDPAHAIGLQMLVVPTPSSEWRQETSGELHAAGAVSARRATYRREGKPAIVRTTQAYVLADGVLGLVTEVQDKAENQRHAERFLRGVHLRDAPGRPSLPQATADEARAIAVAEEFVFSNGYTAKIPLKPREIRPSFQEGGLPPSVLWQNHHDRLRPQAYGISPHQGPHAPGWTVFFEYTGVEDALAGVEMTPDLEKVWMCHYDLRVDAPAKILRSRESGRPATD